MSRAGGTMWMISELSQEAVLTTQRLCNGTCHSSGYGEEREQKFSL